MSGGVHPRSASLSSEMKTSLVLTKEQGFVAAAVKAVKAIVDGGGLRTGSCVEGLPFQLAGDGQQSYMVNDIFLTRVNASDVLLSISDCNDEVNCIRMLNSLHIDGLFTCLTACIDYKGHRYLAQSRSTCFTARATISSSHSSRSSFSASESPQDAASSPR